LAATAAVPTSRELRVSLPLVFIKLYSQILSDTV
jgi:hypothetical protein